MELFFITGNKHKFEEALQLIPSLKQLNLDLNEIQSLNPREILEDKLSRAFEKTGKSNIIVEDTSLNIDALNDLPGSFVKFFLEKIGPEGIFDLVKDKPKKATAICTIGFLDSGNNSHFFKGETEGEIVEPQGSRFGWDPIFKPVGQNKTFAQMGIELKNKLSHRKKAFENLREFLSKVL